MAALRTRSRRRLLAVLAVIVAITGSVLAGLALFGASAETAPAQQPIPQKPIQQSASRNWAGYVVNGKQFSSVSGSWVVPSAKRSSQGYSAFWVGLGGSSSESRSLEQIGTESDYVAGQARYYAWYELVPSASEKLKLTIHPGDQISATVSVGGTTVVASLSDLTTGQSVTKTLSMADPDTSSAEWIAEAPSVSTNGSTYRVLPLADFGNMTFTKASATSDGHAGSIADSQWTAQQMQLVSSTAGSSGPQSGFPGPPPGEAVPAGSSADATSSALMSNGSSFSVSWQSGSSSPTVPPAAAGFMDEAQSASDPELSASGLPR